MSAKTVPSDESATSTVPSQAGLFLVALGTLADILGFRRGAYPLVTQLGIFLRQAVVFLLQLAFFRGFGRNGVLWRLV